MAVWINEFHYDNASGDVGEFIEVAGTAGTDLTGYSLVLYNGNPTSRASYNTLNLTGSLGDQQNGFGTLSFSYPVNGIQNGGAGAAGEPDGIALVAPDSSVVEFISYEGAFAAANGPAAGLTSTNVGAGVFEDGATSGTSIARTGAGMLAGDFAWTLAGDDTPGAVNAGQTFPAAGPSVSVAALSADGPEGDVGDSNDFTFTVTRSSNAGSASVQWTVEAPGGAGEADAADFTGPTSGTVSFAPGQTSQTITVEAAGDTSAETDESFTVQLSSPSAGLSLGAAQASGTIRNDDAAPPADVWINEFHYDNAGADAGEFIEVAGAAGRDLTGYSLVLYNGNPASGASYATIDLGGVIPDQQSGFGTLSFAAVGLQNGGAGAAGEPDGIVLVRPGGTVVEFVSYEGAFIAANGPAAGLTSVNVGSGVFEDSGQPVGSAIARTGEGGTAADFAWVLDPGATAGAVNDGQSFGPSAPRVSIGDLSQAEGNAGSTVFSFVVARTGGTDGFSVDYATADGTALAGQDYTGAGSTTLDFAAGEMSRTVEITVAGDTLPEADETFFVNLSDAVGAVIDDAQATGTIQNDEPAPPSVSISDASVIEGDAGAQDLVFTLTRTGGTQAFSVDYAVAGGTASAGSDFGGAASGVVAFEAGQLTRTIVVPVNGDTVAEGNETLTVTLSNPTNDAVIADGEGAGVILNDDLVRIHDVQGSAHFSPILAADGVAGFNIASTTTVTVEGVVTALDNAGTPRGFFIMEEEADWDGDFRTSEGVFVSFGGASPPASVQVGETVRLTAQVMEFQDFTNLPRTFLVDPTIVSESDAVGDLPILVLDGAGERAIPDAILTDEVPDYFDPADDGADVFDPASDALDFFETVEGMRVTIPDMVVADGFVSGGNSTVYFKAYSRAHADTDQINARGGYTIAGDPASSPPETADSEDDVIRGGRHLHDGDVNPDIVELDFGTNGGVGGTAGFHNQLDMGDSLGDVTGIVGFDFNNVKLYVTEGLDPAKVAALDETTPVQETTTLSADQRSLRVATFNVENLDPTDDATADEHLAGGVGKFNDLGRAIAQNLGAPDIISIEEMQDNNGAAAGDGADATGVDASLSWERLVEAVNTATGQNYQWVDEEPDYNAEGGEQSGNIRVGFLYNTDRVQLGDLAADAGLAERRAFTDRIGDGTRDAGDELAFSDDQLGASIDPADWAGTRKSLLGEFTFNGQKVYVVANHWPSKGGSGAFYQLDQDIDAGQPANGDWAARNELGEDVWTLMDRIATGDADGRIVAAGDFNDFYFYRPLEAVTGYVDADGVARVGGTRFDNLTITELPEAERFSYDFDGRAQQIDFIIADQDLSEVADYDIVHINTGYNGRAGADNPALSDHDPVVAQFDFRSFAEVLSGGAGAETMEGLGGDDTLAGGGGDDSLAGGAGDDLAVYSGARADYTVGLEGSSVRVSDRRAGAPDGGDLLSTIERLRFSDGIVQLAALLNRPPTPAPDSATVVEDASVAIDVLGNDTDPDPDDTVELVSVSPTERGATVRIENGAVIYSADADVFDLLGPGQTAVDRFTYTVEDAAGARATATVAVTVSGAPAGPTRTGGNGADSLAGTAADERILGGNGNDSLSGGEGADTLDGGNGDDTLSGGQGPDNLSGGNGRDTFSGGEGADTLAGGNDNDRMEGGAGADSLVGENGADTLIGGEGADTLSGFNGDDRMEAGQGADSALGWNGDDTFAGGEGDDVFDGGNGADRLVIAPNFGADRFLDFDPGEDRIQFDRGVFDSFGAVQEKASQVGRDVVIAYDADDSVTLAGVRLDDLGARDFVFA